VELANGALGDPVLGLVGVPGARFGLLALLILDGRLLVAVLLALNEALRALTALGAVFDAAGDSQGVGVGPCDIDILLLEAGKFAV